MSDGGPPAELDAAVGAIALADHHVHPALATELSLAGLEKLITESDRPVPPGITRFDSQLGIAIRRWCCPVLGLPASAPAQAYIDRRRELGAAGVTRLLLRAAGVSQLLLLLRGFCELTQERAVPLMLLHCYPYHRQAGYLAHAYPHVHVDVGLPINHVGARAPAVVAESLELAPFGKVLFSSDAWGPPELHYLGALLWRRATARVLGQWVESADWALADAISVAGLIGAQNARRVYRLS